MALGFLITFLIVYPLRIRLTPWPGSVLILYLCVEPPLRFLIEFSRGDSDRGFVGPFSTSQLPALFVTPLAAIGLWLLTRRPPTPTPVELARGDSPPGQDAIGGIRP
jgi:prolipoprotein diacylglyceryltransferase